MGIAAGLAGAAAAASLGSTVSSAIGGGAGAQATGFSSGSTPPGVYQPQAQPQFDQGYQTLVNSMMPYATSMPGQLIPGYQQYAGNIQGNPYAQLAQRGAGGAADYGQMVAPRQIGFMQAMNNVGDQSVQRMMNVPDMTGYGRNSLDQAFDPRAVGYGFDAAHALGGAAGNMLPYASSLLPYAQQIMQTGFDPQQQLQDRTMQQLRDQMNVSAAQSGTAGSPYAAGLANQGMSNFLIDWQNNQLARQSQAAQGAGAVTSAAGRLYDTAGNLVNAGSGALNDVFSRQGAAAGTYGRLSDATRSAYDTYAQDAGRGYGLASDLGTAGINSAYSSSMLPYATYLGQQRDNLGALDSLSGGATSALGIPGAMFSPMQSYLGLGQQAANYGRLAAGQNFSNNAMLGAGFGNAANQFGNLASKYNWFGSGSSPWDYTYGSPSGYQDTTAALNPGYNSAGGSI